MARAGEGINVIPDLVRISVKLDRKTLFADLDMLGQRAIREPETVWLVDDVDNAARAQGMKTEMVCEKSDGPSGFYRRVMVNKVEARHLKHFPLSDRLFRFFKNIRASAEQLAVVVDNVTLGR